MAESVNALLKTELHRNPAALVAHDGHWKGLDDLKVATYGWIRWFTRRVVNWLGGRVTGRVGVVLDAFLKLDDSCR